MQQSNTDLFLDRYRYMEHLVKTKYHLNGWESIISYLEKHREFRDYVDELAFCRDVRNLLSHKPKLSGEYCIEVHDELIHLLNQVIERLEKPPVIMEIAVPLSRIVYKRYDDKLLDTLKQMNERSFGYVPILRDGIVEGVVSERTIINYIVQEQSFQITEELRLKDMKQYFMLENHKRELFRFVSKDSLVSDVAELFHGAINKGSRIGMVFVTKNGKPEEKILGIVTAWDVAGNR